MHGLVFLLTEIILGQVEGSSNRMTQKVWWRFPVYFIILGAALWVAISSALLWTSASHPGVVGLLDYVRHGGPAWMLNIPIVALLIIIVGSLPVAGRYGLVLVFQAALFWLVLIGLANFQGDGQSEVNLAAVSSFLVTLPATVLALVTALADIPPVTSPLAQFNMMYIGRIRHLRRLLATASQFGWEAAGPSGPARAYTVSGYYGAGRHVRVVSGVSWQGESAADQGYWYKVTVTSPSALPAFEIARREIPTYIAARAVTRMVASGLNPIRFYVIPQYGGSVREEWVQRYTQHIVSGTHYLHYRESVQITSGGILYTHFSVMRLPARSNAIEPLIEWLVGLVHLLEEIAQPVDQAENLAPGNFAAKLPYGHMSDVDSTQRTW